MIAPDKPLLSYHEIRARERTHPFFQREVPVEHFKSLPVPTLRWGGPAFAAFASPARRAPRQPLAVSEPDRWWSISATNGRLQAYALTSAVPFTDAGLDSTVTIAPSAGAQPPSLAEQKAHLDAVEALFDAASASFFAGEPGSAEARAALAEALRSVIPEPLAPHYRALAPDFFTWLEG
jgi:hypothetical protein